AEMRTLGVLEPVLPARRVEVAAGRGEGRRLTSTDGVDVECVAPGREIREPQGDSYAVGGVGQHRRAERLAFRVSDVSPGGLGARRRRCAQREQEGSCQESLCG